MNRSIRTIDNPLLSLPKKMEGLAELASNLYWTWHEDAKSVLRAVDPGRSDRGDSPVQIIVESPKLGELEAANMVPNASILDGWWDEGYEGEPLRNGFAVGERQPQRTRRLQDKRNAVKLSCVLLNEALQMYWKLNRDGLPTAWIDVMKNAIATSLYAFSTRRMLTEYCQLYRG